MVLLNGTRIVSLPVDSHRSMVLIIRRLLPPVTKMTSIHTLLTLASSRQLPLYQIDVKNVFLNGDLSEIFYMQSPPGITASPGLRALYGLKQASRARYERFCQSLFFAGYTQKVTDYAMFRRSTP